jgi:DNA invertase Pin-like site-specific DNA recombinase
MSVKSKNKGNGRPLRFAALVRVSTERQEKVGESLRTQRKQNERDVARLGGTIVGWYGGAESAMSGDHEKVEVDRLIADAGRGKFDAVIVAYADRWSRDNAKSKEGLEVFRRSGVRFYIGTTEMDLFDPQHRFILGMNAEVGEFFVLQQAKKSLENRIERARDQNAPTCGDLPFGRTWDKEKGWSIIPEKQQALADIADRYLAGEPLAAVAAEHGLNPLLVYRVLRKKGGCAGDTWMQHFLSERLGIDEPVETKVPPLLPDEIIRRVRQAMDKVNSGVRHGRPRSDCLLAGRIFCSGCGLMLTPEYKRGTWLYLHPRHLRRLGDRLRECSLGQPRPRVRVDWADSEVLFRLFGMFGNPTLLRRAVKAAVPDTSEELERRRRLEGELAKVDRARDRILGLVTKDALTDAQAEKQLLDLKVREAGLRDELDKLAAVLANMPSEEAVALYVEKVQESIVVIGDEEEMTDEDGRRWHRGSRGGNDLGTWLEMLEMTREDKQRLVEAAFPLRQLRPDGTVPGIFVVPAPKGAVMPRPGFTEADLDEHGSPPMIQTPWGLDLRGLLTFDAVVPGVPTRSRPGVEPCARLRPSAPPFAFSPR